MKKPRRDNVRYRPSLKQRFAHFLNAHLESAAITLKQIGKNPFTSFLGLGIFAIVMSLPVSLYWTTFNLKIWLEPWKNGGNVTVFLQKNISPVQMQSLNETLERLPQVAHIKFISSKQALEEFNQFSGLGDVVAALGENPLPPVLLVTPRDWQTNTVKSLENFLKQQPLVEQFQFDMAWIMRLQALLSLLEKAVIVLSALLGTGLLLVIGHTIRANVLSRAQEISITKWVGAPDGFVKRPFLYAGFWFGLMGGALGLTVVSLSFIAIRPALFHLFESYGSQWQWVGLSWISQIGIIGSCAFLGTTGAYLATTHYLRQIRPQ